ncbi:TIGR04283 family arsenosugar biosynthesis glycosyltransferase [Thermomonas sp. S9]|uniref:TIGR04283 family arsenosugar biosynthesis glycosyltransferase n=1 Tax=Thermomonas sp. S9 TaxID=2885203 RepID=UPI00216B5C08|nr:TIGR04283 family arsenosugar biosynthesis glycosyltransferase [Thermomonas sp. S9]MCR6496522.1 TIGR04283 family arsenosugar biosynthesis glycosyltransferase [Thermomonas sp. S9]
MSIIVPMLDEAAQLPALCAHLMRFARAGAEVLLVDGGSRDGSAAIARAAGLRVLDSTPSRACQMNVGAHASTGEALLFLHADTRLPDGALLALLQALQGRAWGRFDVRIEGTSRMLPVVAMMMNLRSRLSGIATGDQALFMTRAAFYAVGGFPKQPLMEDIDICRALKRRLGRPACLRLHARTSGRRWETRGVWRTIALMWWLRWRHFCGAPVEQLARTYR